MLGRRAPVTIFLPPWSDSLLRLGLVLALALVLGLPLALMAFVRSPMARDVGEPPIQPVQFDHRHHVRDDGIDCLYCHADATRSRFAGVPSTEVCMGCHGQIWNESPQLRAVRESWIENRPIHWARVYDLADFVFFDHQAHVGRGVGCETCHGRVDEMPLVHREVPLTMAWCLDCHRDPDEHLRAQSELTLTGLAPDRERGARIRAARHIDPPTHCTGCHR
jgi:hypothetical protein